MNQANHILKMHRNNVTGSQRVVIIPFLLSVGEADPETLGPPVQEVIEKLEKVHWSAAKVVSGLEHMNCKRMLMDLGLGNLAKRWLRKGLKLACTYMKGNGKEPNCPH